VGVVLTVLPAKEEEEEEEEEEEDISYHRNGAF
jgi:hypothetical protein